MKRLSLIIVALAFSAFAVGADSKNNPESPAAFPPRDALDVEAADMDRDGRVDLIYLTGGSAPAVRIFFGDAAGFAAGRVEEMPIERVATGGKFTLADLNNDGRPDIVVTAGGDNAFVYWNRFWSGRGNLRQWSRTPLTAMNPTSAAFGDFDQDGLVDLLVSGADNLVYWGSATRTFVTRPPTSLSDLANSSTRSTARTEPPVAAALPVPRQVERVEHIVLNRQPEKYSAFPALYHVRGPNEALHVHFGAGETTSHVESRQEQHDYVSTDGGRTWQRTTKRALNPAWQSRPGRLVNASAHGWRHVGAERRAALEAQGFEVRNAPDGRVTYSAGCFLRVSDDNGVTWKERELDLPQQALISGYHDAVANLRLDNRTILRAIYGKPVSRVRYYESWLLRSEDDGETWSFGTIAADPSRDDHGFSETAIAQAANGDIVAMMRIEPPTGTRLWVARSADRGKTWSPAQETLLRGFPAHLLTLRDGRLLCTYGYREQPIGIRAAISRDDGRTWREQDLVSLRSDGSGPPSDSGYPITAELADGTLVTVHYITRDGITGVEATRWKDPWR